MEGKNNNRPTEIMPLKHHNAGRPTEVMKRNAGAMNGANFNVSRSHISIGTLIDDYSLTGVITENTGEAALFLCNKDGKEFVAKVYHPDKRPKDEILKTVKSITSPFILEIIDSGEHGGRYYEIFPYFGNGDLQKAAPLAPEFIINTVVGNLNNALFVLHNKDIVHRDVKPDNIFFNNDMKSVILGDFGICSILESGSTVRLTSSARTPGYSAPETAQGFVSKESDYYSLGVTLLHLATGVDPFLGMTDTQILMHTLNYRLEIPDSVHPRISHLIQGLTVKERQDRWGYEEVKRWLNNENVEIKTQTRVNTDVKAYVFEGREFYTLSEFALSISESWEEGKKHLYRGFIRDWVKQFGQDLASKTMDIEEEEKNQDLGLFKLIYTIYPDALLCWKGYIFADLKAFGEAINKEIPHINKNYLELMTSGALEYFLNKKGYSAELLEEVNRLMDLAEMDNEKAYFELSYLLGGTTEFRFNNGLFRDVEEFISYLYDAREDLENISEQLLNNKYFFAWLGHLGFGDQIEKWKEIEY